MKSKIISGALFIIIGISISYGFNKFNQKKDQEESTNVENQYACKDKALANNNFRMNCKSFILLNESSTGRKDMYSGNPCECIVENYKVIVDADKDCNFPSNTVLGYFIDEKVKDTCIHRN